MPGVLAQMSYGEAFKFPWKTCLVTMKTLGLLGNLIPESL